MLECFVELQLHTHTAETVYYHGMSS